MLDLVKNALDVFLHLDAHLNEWAIALGPWLYVVLFLVVFCETGLVVTPFLPGDSLLFAIGALASAMSENFFAIARKMFQSLFVSHAGSTAADSGWMKGCMSEVLRSCFSYQVAVGSTTSE